MASSRRWSGALPVRGQLLDPVVGLLRERQVRIGAVERRLSLRDHLRPRAGLDIGELGVGDASAASASRSFVSSSGLSIS